MLLQSAMNPQLNTLTHNTTRLKSCSCYCELQQTFWHIQAWLNIFIFFILSQAEYLALSRKVWQMLAMLGDSDSQYWLFMRPNSALVWHQISCAKWAYTVTHTHLPYLSEIKLRFIPRFKMFLVVVRLIFRRSLFHVFITTTIETFFMNAI